MTPVTSGAVIVGAHECPDRVIPDRSLAQIHREVALGALDDCGLTLADVDGYLCDSTAPGFSAASMAEYLGLSCRFVDTTEIGGASYITHVAHAALAIAAGRCNVALITLAGRPRSGGVQPGGMSLMLEAPEAAFDNVGMFRPYSNYALVAQRHMYEFGTTSEQLAWIRVAASQHAQHNPHAAHRRPVTVEEVVASPVVSSPLRRLDCCVLTDGGGAVVVTSEAIARGLGRSGARLRGYGEALRYWGSGQTSMTISAAAGSGPRAFAEAQCSPADIDYASIYDSFTITVLVALEDLGFCAKGEGGRFVEDGGLVSGVGHLPVNTDGGGLCNNHPGNRGGMTKMIEALRQLRGEAAPAVQVPGCELALVHGTGGALATRHFGATAILERWDAR